MRVEPCGNHDYTVFGPDQPELQMSDLVADVGMDDSQATHAEMNKRIAEKQKRCATEPIKTWVAEYLQATVKDIFGEDAAEPEVLAFRHEDVSYIGTLVTFGEDAYELPDAKLVAHEDVRSKISMLFDAVQNNWKDIFLKVDEKYHDRMIGIAPVFDNDRLAFYFTRVNTSVFIRSTLEKQIAELTMAREIMTQEIESKGPKADEFSAQIENLEVTLEGFKSKAAAYTDEVVLAEEKLCAEATGLKSSWLTISIYEAKDEEEEDRMSLALERMTAV